MTTDDRIVRRCEVQVMTGLARSTIYDWVSKGRFPRPLRLGPRAVGWRVSDVRAWLAARPCARAEASEERKAL